MKKKKFTATAVALAMAAVTVFPVGGNYAYANSDTSIAIQAEATSESVVLPVSVASEAWVYHDRTRIYGTWKALNIKVNDTMYPLSKDGAVNVTFHNGDEIKIYSGDSYELWEGIISISGGEVKVKSQNNKYNECTGTTDWSCNLVYSDGTLIFNKTKNYSGGLNGGGIISVHHNIFYDYDLTAKTEAGVPIEGISVVDESYTNRFGGWVNWDMMILNGYLQKHSTWGNGNSFDVEIKSVNELKKCVIKSTRVTDRNGLIDMYLPEEVKGSNTGFEKKYKDIYIGGDISAEIPNFGYKKVFKNNGLVDVTINDKYYASPIFVIPKFQNNGIASNVIKQLFDIYPNTIEWWLSTIKQEEKNCHLYEKCGFVRTGDEIVVNENMTLVFYVKSYIEVRRFKEEDAKEVRNLIVRNFLEVNSKDYGISAMEKLAKVYDVEKVLNVASYAHMYVFEFDGKIIGTGSISSFWGSETESILLSIFVLPEFHGKGVGRKIINTLETDEFYVRASRIEIPASITATEFYRKFGYDYKNGVKELDDEHHYRLEKFKAAGLK